MEINVSSSSLLIINETEYLERLISNLFAKLRKCSLQQQEIDWTVRVFVQLKFRAEIGILFVTKSTLVINPINQNQVSQNVNFTLSEMDSFGIFSNQIDIL